MKIITNIITAGILFFMHGFSFGNTVEIEKRIDTLYKWFEKMGSPGTVAQAIDKAQRFEPKDFLENNKKFAAVIFLHGCSGITKEEISWARLLSDNGYYVILPDSFARDKRRMNCNPNDPKWKAGGFLNAFAYRQEEIAAAVQNLKINKKIDEKNIFLIGFSEGAVATAQTIQKGLKGQVILAWTCTLKGQNNFEGINQLEDIPVMAISASADPWRIGTTNFGRCADSLHANKKFQQIDIDGAFHDLFHNETSRNAVLRFLKNNSVGE